MDGGPDDDPTSEHVDAASFDGRGSSDADRWLAEQRVDDAVGTRRRAADLRQQASQEGTLHGVLVDLAERDRPVVLRTAAGIEHRVTLAAVGADVVTGRTTRGEHVAVNLTAVATVRAEPGAPATLGDRTGGPSSGPPLTLVGHLQELAAVRPDAVAHLRDGSSASGTLLAVGADVLSIRGRDGDRSTTHVAVAALSDVVVLDSSELV